MKPRDENLDDLTADPAASPLPDPSPQAAQEPDAAAQQPAIGGVEGEESAVDREAMDRLVQNDRLKLEARMPKKDYTDEQINDLASRTKDFIKHNAISFRGVSRQIGYSTAVVYEFIKGKYKGDRDAVARSLASWLERARGGHRFGGRRITSKPGSPKK